MLVVFCLLFYFILLYVPLVLSASCASLLWQCSDHVGLSALINLIRFDLIQLLDLVWPTSIVSKYRRRVHI